MCPTSTTRTYSMYKVTLQKNNRSPTDVQRQHIPAGADPYSEPITRVFNCTSRHETCRYHTTAKESRSRCRQPRKLPSNIRTSFVSKLLEKHVAIQIRQHMEFNDLFDTFQSAYRSAHSCETAMVHIQDDILKALDSGKHIILVLLDLSAALDSVDHDILIDKLHMIGVRGDALCWVESYLSARTQVIRIGEATSQPIHLPCGVPCATRQCTRTAAF